MKNQNIILSLVVLGSFALCPAPNAFGVSPPPDGAYPNENTAEGEDALLSLTDGIENSAVGYHALFSDTRGSINTATGAFALSSNTRGDFNTATGAAALFSNTTGVSNTATGGVALESNTTGFSNTATGVSALHDNTTGNFNTATGAFALDFNRTGGANTAVGHLALQDNNGNNNTATGFQALRLNATGSNNTANGFQALSNSTGFNNVAVGAGAGSGVTNANNVICVGAFLSGLNENNSCFISNIFGARVGGNAVPVSIDSTGKLGTFTSSRRFKKEIKPMDKVSEAILSLKPVTFRYKSDKTDAPQFGLIAEEVAEVNPELVVRDKEGKPYTVRYDAVNAMLLNEFLKEHKKVEAQQTKIDEQQATIAKLKSTVAQQQKSFQSKLADQERQISALESGLQKVSAQVEISRPGPKTVLNNQ